MLSSWIPPSTSYIKLLIALEEQHVFLAPAAIAQDSPSPHAAAPATKAANTNAARVALIGDVELFLDCFMLGEWERQSDAHAKGPKGGQQGAMCYGLTMAIRRFEEPFSPAAPSPAGGMTARVKRRFEEH